MHVRTQIKTIDFRLILIVEPFYQVNKLLIKRYLILYCLLKFSCSAAAWFLLREVEFGGLPEAVANHLQEIHDILIIACFSLNFLNCVVGVVSSMVSFYHLCCHGHENTLILKSSITIFLMNVPYVISLICNVAAIRAKFQYGFFYASFIMLHMFISAYNPCVIITRTTHVRETIRSLITGRKVLDLQMSSGVSKSRAPYP